MKGWRGQSCSLPEWTAALCEAEGRNAEWVGDFALEISRNSCVEVGNHLSRSMYRMSEPGPGNRAAKKCFSTGESWCVNISTRGTAEVDTCFDVK